MTIKKAPIPVLIAALLAVSPALAESVAVTSGPNGTVVINGKPCRIVSADENGSGSTAKTDQNRNSTSITTGPGGLSGTTTITPGNGVSASTATAGSGSSVAVGSSTAGGDGAQVASGAGSDCLIYLDRHKK
jgi:hypothetical protein